MRLLTAPLLPLALALAGSPVLAQGASWTLDDRSIRLGEPFEGRIDIPGDRDAYKVDLAAGRSYVVTVARDGFNPFDGDYVSGVADPRIVGIRRDGAVRFLPGTANDDSGLSTDARLVYTPQVSGAFQIVVGAAGGATGDYVVRIVEGSDLPANTTSTLVMTPEAAAQSRLGGPEDVDWIRFDLPLDLGGDDRLQWAFLITSGSDRIQATRLFAVNGRLISERDPDLGLEFSQTRPGGSIYVAVTGGTGDYELTAYRSDFRLTPPDAELNVDAPAGWPSRNAVGRLGRFQGVIQTRGDRDWIGVQLASGKRYRLSIAATEESLDPELFGIFSAEGIRLEGLQRTGAGPVSLELAPRQSGLHYLSIGGRAGSVGDYEVRLEPIETR